MDLVGISGNVVHLTHIWDVDFVVYSICSSGVSIKKRVGGMFPSQSLAL